MNLKSILPCLSLLLLLIGCGLNQTSINGNQNSIAPNPSLNYETYEPQPSDLVISRSEYKNQLEVSIQDQGCGINDENINNIYDPFFTTKEEGDGSGLGLSISLGIIESHNGSLTIKNNAENIKGTTATLILPVQHH